VSSHRANEAELIEVLDRFCSGFASRDADAVLIEGDTTYTWEWHRHDVSIAGSLAWLLAEGTETAASEGGVARHPYRMTMVLERRDHRWLARQVHGSSPH
jgi:hypothetical protein